jgi:transcriptional regulator with XRE-family HTH domain
MYPNLKLQIWRSGIRQNHLARLLEVDESILSRMINGFRKPTPELKARIATVLHAEEAWLFEEAKADRMASGLQ